MPLRTVDGVTYRVDRYRPRIEGLFARIERWTNATNVIEVFWCSISKDNITTWYGRTADSRIADPSDAGRVFRWLICQSHDDKGNVIVYGYKAEDSAKVFVDSSGRLLPLLPPGEPVGIVSIGSMAGDLTVPGMSLYVASKAALHAFTRAAGIEMSVDDHFSLLVIIGTMKSTNFKSSVRHPTTGQPGWYHRLDVDAQQAAALIVKAIQKEKSQLVIPGWYGIVLRTQFTNQLLSPSSPPAVCQL